MPLRYKKFIVLFTLAIMLIGMGTFSLIAPNLDFSFQNMLTGGKTPADMATEGKTQKEIDAELTELVKLYFDAKLRVDMKEVANYVSDVSHVDERKLLAESEYIEAFQNISCTIEQGYDKGSYRIYVYHDDKYFDIDTTIPSLTALYVKAIKDGQFVIYTGTIEGEEKEAIDALDTSEEVKKLQDEVNQKLQLLIDTDEQVREFYEMLENNSSSQEEEESTDNIAGEVGSAQQTQQNTTTQ